MLLTVGVRVCVQQYLLLKVVVQRSARGRNFQYTLSFLIFKIQNLHILNLMVSTILIMLQPCIENALTELLNSLLPSSHAKHTLLIWQHNSFQPFYRARILRCATFIHCGSLSCTCRRNPKFDLSAEGHQKIFTTAFVTQTVLLK